jgi:hypothetical protein
MVVFDVEQSLRPGFKIRKIRASKQKNNRNGRQKQCNMTSSNVNFSHWAFPSTFLETKTWIASNSFKVEVHPVLVLQYQRWKAMIGESLVRKEVGKLLGWDSIWQSHYRFPWVWMSQYEGVFEFPILSHVKPFLWCWFDQRGCCMNWLRRLGQIQSSVYLIVWARRECMRWVERRREEEKKNSGGWKKGQKKEWDVE